MEKNQFQIPSIESQTIEKLTAQLLTANTELQKMQMQRSEMLANISHDLRAPITAIRSAVDVLLSSPELSKEDLDSTLQIIDRRTKTLENMIQDMYYLFCVEDTSRDLDFTQLSASAILEEYFYDAIVDTRYDNHNMQLDLPDDLSCNIRVDIQKLIRVLDNLFTNAAKYTPAGSSITLKAREEGHRLVISVIDTGDGIPAEEVGKLFQRTYTASKARTPGGANGSGLGLAIVKAIVERFGGTVWCESKEGAGSTFFVSLPAIYGYPIDKT